MGLVVTGVAINLFRGRFTEHKQRECTLALARDRSAALLYTSIYGASSRIHSRIAAQSSYEEQTARTEASALSSWSCVFSNSALLPLDSVVQNVVGSFNVVIFFRHSLQCGEG
jgi:hypothetical protein